MLVRAVRAIRAIRAICAICAIRAIRAICELAQLPTRVHVVVHRPAQAPLSSNMMSAPMVNQPQWTYIDSLVAW